jgi:hypothetical protein
MKLKNRVIDLVLVYAASKDERPEDAHRALVLAIRAAELYEDIKDLESTDDLPCRRSKAERGT